VALLFFEESFGRRVISFNFLCSAFGIPLFGFQRTEQMARHSAPAHLEFRADCDSLGREKNKSGIRPSSLSFLLLAGLAATGFLLHHVMAAFRTLAQNQNFITRHVHRDNILIAWHYGNTTDAGSANLTM